MTILGGAIGTMGLIFIFFDEINNFTFSNMTSYGIFLGIIATYFASLGNLVSAHTSKINLPVVPVTGYGMLIWLNQFFNFSANQENSIFI